MPSLIHLVCLASCVFSPVLSSSISLNNDHQDQIIMASPPSEENTTKPTIYFGYGSNLWLHQMSLRCPTSEYLGVARLDGYRWIINDRGYANVVKTANSTFVTAFTSASSPEEGPRGGLDEDENGEGADSKHAKYDDVVFGLVYSLQPGDESRLDKNEGVPIAYTKENLSVDFWSIKTPGQPSWVDVKKRPTKVIDMLVYIDRNRTAEDKPKTEYIYRMNRGIEDAVAMGVPKEYVKDVMREFIPEDGESAEEKDVSKGMVKAKEGRREKALKQAQRFEDESGVFTRTD